MRAVSRTAQRSILRAHTTFPCTRDQDADLEDLEIEDRGDLEVRLNHERACIASALARFRPTHEVRVRRRLSAKFNVLPDSERVLALRTAADLASARAHLAGPRPLFAHSNASPRRLTGIRD